MSEDKNKSSRCIGKISSSIKYTLGFILFAKKDILNHISKLPILLLIYRITLPVGIILISLNILNTYENINGKSHAIQWIVKSLDTSSNTYAFHLLFLLGIALSIHLIEKAKSYNTQIGTIETLAFILYIYTKWASLPGMDTPIYFTQIPILEWEWPFIYFMAYLITISIIYFRLYHKSLQPKSTPHILSDRTKGEYLCNVELENKTSKLSEDEKYWLTLGNEIALNAKSERTKDTKGIAIKGAWGSGKSTLLEIIEFKLKKDKYKVITINPSLYSQMDALLIDTIRTIEDAIHEPALKSEFDNYIQALSEFESKIGILNTFYRFITGKSQYGNTIDSARKNLVEKIEISVKKRIIIIIDDLDRLHTHEEVMQAIRVIRLIAQLPNINYIAAFDKEKIDYILQNDSQKLAKENLMPSYSRKEYNNLSKKSIHENIFKDESDEQHFFDKIFQVYYTMPEFDKGTMYQNYGKYLIELSNTQSTEINTSYIKVQKATEKLIESINNHREVKIIINNIESKIKLLEKHFMLNEVIIMELLNYKYNDYYKLIRKFNFTLDIFNLEYFQKIYKGNDKLLESILESLYEFNLLENDDYSIKNAIYHYRYFNLRYQPIDSLFIELNEVILAWEVIENNMYTKFSWVMKHYPTPFQSQIIKYIKHNDNCLKYILNMLSLIYINEKRRETTDPYINGTREALHKKSLSYPVAELKEITLQSFLNIYFASFYMKSILEFASNPDIDPSDKSMMLTTKPEFVSFVIDYLTELSNVIDSKVNQSINQAHPDILPQLCATIESLSKEPAYQNAFNDQLLDKIKSLNQPHKK